VSEAPQTTVVVIDDAPEIGLCVEAVLSREGFRVRTALDGGGGLALARSEQPELVVLDLGLPDMDGLDVCRALRRISDAYVIILSSRRSEADRVAGLSAGADDYLVKPFSTAELVARVRAMLRRPRHLSADGPVRRLCDLEIDLEACEVRRAGQVVPLTRIEFALLEALLDNPRRVRGRTELLTRVWGPEWAEEHNLIDVHISKLRRKLGDDGRAPTYVLTVRGAGYRLCDPLSTGAHDGAPGGADGEVPKGTGPLGRAASETEERRAHTPETDT
jgi:DNA-binding response OmpR family regulator